MTDQRYDRLIVELISDLPVVSIGRVTALNLLTNAKILRRQVAKIPWTLAT